MCKCGVLHARYAHLAPILNLQQLVQLRPREGPDATTATFPLRQVPLQAHISSGRKVRSTARTCFRSIPAQPHASVRFSQTQFLKPKCLPKRHLLRWRHLSKGHEMSCRLRKGKGSSQMRMCSGNAITHSALILKLQQLVRVNMTRLLVMAAGLPNNTTNQPFFHAFGQFF